MEPVTTEVVDAQPVISLVPHVTAGELDEAIGAAVSTL
jgi:hypothetical protein